MKKIFTSICLTTLFIINSQSQTVIINTGTAGTPAYNAGPVYRSAAASAFDASRYTYLYTAAELAAAGITSGAVINLVGWVKNNTATSLGVGGIFRIYMKNTATASFSLASETWANLNSGATLVYENLTQTIPATATPNYIDFPLTTTFIYTGGSLEISTEWDINQVSGNASTGTFDWLWSTVTDRIYGTGNTTLAPITTLSSTTNSISTIDDRRPFIKITYTGGTTGIDLGAQSLVAPTSPNNCYTSTETVTIRIRNYSTNPIDFSVNPVTVTTNVTGAVTQTLTAVVNTGTLAPASTLDVPMSATLNMSSTGVYTFNAFTTVTGDVTPANNAMPAVNITKAVLAAGTVSVSPGSYCVTPGTPTLSTTGATGYGSLQWQESLTPGAGFTNIPGATTNPYTLGSPITQTMYYRLLASCNGTTITSNEVTVTLNNPQITGTTPGASCGPGPVTVILGATGTGSTINWYDVASGGVPVGTGPSFTTPPISTNTTYYVATGSGGGLANVGLPARFATATSGAGTTNFGLVFDALAAFTLNSVVVYPISSAAGTAGTVTIDVVNSTGVVLHTATVNVVGNPAASATAQTVTLNFNIVPGTNLKLRPGSRSAGITGLLFEPSAAAPGGNYGYPFVVPGVLSINHSTLTAPPTNTPRLDLYYYFYNWDISTGCESARTAVLATITTPPTASISYAASPYCSDAGTATVTQTGTVGGTYTASPAGLTINPATGAVTLGTSTPGTYTVTYTIPASGGCLLFSTTTSITVLNCGGPCSAITTIACAAATTATLAGAGSWSPGSCGFSTPGNERVYSFTPTVTGVYSLQVTSTNSGGFVDYFYKAASGGCSASGWTCIDDVFSPTTSTIGTLTAGVEYYILLDAEVTASVIHTFQVNCLCPDATIAYAGSPYCSNAGIATVTRTGTADGTYSAAPAGLTLNAATGDVTLGTSTPGTYTVTYTIAPGACLVFTTTATITITGAPAATIVYTASPYCQNAGTANVTRIGTAGGTYTAAPAGLTINASTGAVTLGTSTPGTYTVTYTIAASGGCGSFTTTTSITVNPTPTAVASPSSQAVCSGTPITTIALSGGVAGTTYTWTRNNTGTVTGIAANGTGNISGTLTNTTNAPVIVTFTITPTANGCTGTAITATVTVNPIPNAVATPVTQTVCSGTPITTIALTGAVTGTTYAWTRNNTVNVTGIAANGTGNISGTLTNTTTGQQTVVFTITPTANGCAGTPITATVIVDKAPAITCPANITLPSVVGSCTAVVTYTPTVTGSPVPTLSYVLTGATSGSGSGSGSGTVFSIGVTTVTITATNTCGTATCSFTVTVTDSQLPVINVQPANRTVCTGSNVIFSVTAVTAPSAGGLLAYQWQAWNGTTWTNIAGATASTLNVNNVTVSMNTNSYRVQVTGLCTMINSAHASLYVNPLPLVNLATSIAPNLLPGQVLTITATTSPSGGSYVWFKDGQVIAGASGSTLPNLTVIDAGVYRVVYTDPNGCTSTSADITIAAQQSDNLYVYPVPNNGQFIVRYYNTANEQLNLRVIDAKGSLVYQSKILTTVPYSTINVDLRNGRVLASGIYIVEVRRADGRLAGSRRIVVY